ncbi:MAG: hypothetical protein ACOY3P_15995 [Planctomycetota bacterium]
MNWFLTYSPYIAAFATAFAAVALFLALWRRRELRREHALEVLGRIEGWGIEPLNRVLRAYAIGNYLGQGSILRTIREVVAELRSGGIVPMLRGIAWKVVEHVFLKSPGDRQELGRLLEAARAAAAMNEEPSPPPSV